MPIKKRIFFKAITEMNSSLLEVLLEELPICQNLRNALFIKRMENIFCEFKQNNDTCLHVYEGNCHSSNCSKKCKGYIIVGNHSQKHIHFICEEKNFEIINLFPLENALTSIYIKTEDEKSLSFPQTYFIDTFDYDGRYNNVIQQMDNAISELIHDNDGYLTQYNYMPWVEKYKWLAEESKDIKSKFKHDFFEVYRKVEELTSFLQQKDKVINLLKEYDLINKMGEKEVLKWLVKHENYGIDIMVFLVDYFDCDVVNGFVSLLTYDKQIFIYHNDFMAFENFHAQFDELYYSKLHEYTTYDSPDIYDILPYEERHTIYSLQFHLEKRGINFYD